jgi:ribosomal protein S18 acetylase RimI-like enzyme
MRFNLRIDHNMVPTDPQALVAMDDLQVIIRKARDADAAPIAVLATQVWLHTYATEGISAEIADYTRNELIPEKYQAIQKDSAAHLWVAERGACLIGFAVLKWGAACPVSSLTLAELQTLYVQAHFARQGVGRQLLSVAEKEAGDVAGMPLWLSVNAHNAQAIGFYMRQGYTKQGVMDFELGQQRHQNFVMIGRTPPCP